jgi:cytochrome c
MRCLIATLLTLYIANAHAASDSATAFTLAKQNACLGCHAVDRKVVGPSFQSIAKKYVGDSNAKVFLKNKIRNGGSGSWGVVPMPANAKLSDEDLNSVTSWILRGAPSPN